MSVLLVTYDLRAPGRNYDALHNYLKTNFTYCKGMESVWLLDTNVEPGSLRDQLRKVVDANDKILVIRVTRQWASTNYGCGDWLNSNERSF